MPARPHSRRGAEVPRVAQLEASVVRSRGPGAHDNRKACLSRRQRVRLAVLVRQQPVRRLVVGEALGLGVPLQVRLRPVGDVADQRGRSVAVALLDVAGAGLRLLTQSRKLRAWSAVSAFPPVRFFGSICALAPTAPALLNRAVQRRAGGELVGREHLRHHLVAVAVEVERPLRAAELDLGLGPASAGRRWRCTARRSPACCRGRSTSPPSCPAPRGCPRWRTCRPSRSRPAARRGRAPSGSCRGSGRRSSVSWPPE